MPVLNGLLLLVAVLCHATKHEGHLTWSCTRVTRPPMLDLQHVHERMPALLLSRGLEVWSTGSAEVALGVVASWTVGVLEVLGRLRSASRVMIPGAVMDTTARYTRATQWDLQAEVEKIAWRQTGRVAATTPKL